MWENYNSPPVAAPRSLEGDDELLLMNPGEFATDYTTALFDMQAMPDLNNNNNNNNIPYLYTNPPSQQPYSTFGEANTTMYSPSRVPQSPTISSDTSSNVSSPPYAVPSPNSTTSTSTPTTPETAQPPPFVDIKPQLLPIKQEKKRKADIEQWGEYNNPSKAYSDLYDSEDKIISKDISIRTRISADNLEYSHIDDAHIMYRQNQFSLEIDFVGELAQYTSSGGERFHVLKRTSTGNKFEAVEGLFFYIYAVKHQRGQPFDSELVELMQACGSRTQKEHQVPGLCAIVNGRGLYSKLQFRAATANNARSGKTAQTQPNPQQQFYRIIIALVAKTSDSLDFVCTRISPYLVVRGQNPGRFKPLPPVPNTPPATPLLAEPPVPPPKPSSAKRSKKPQRGSKRARFTEDEDDDEVEEDLPVAVPSPDHPAPVPALGRAPAHVIAPVPAPSLAPLAMPVHMPVHTQAPTHMHVPIAIPVPAPATLAPIPEPAKWNTGISTDAVCVAGKVGINTATPTEALTVIGNIMLTGDVIKPSDQRVKTNIKPVSTASQLANIEALQIYDYDLIHGKAAGDSNDHERGVMAQQLQQILPSATKTVNNVTMADGKVVDELVVVQDRVLLFENIGATQELSSMVKKDQELLQNIDKKFEGRIQEESIAVEKTLNAAEKLLDYMIVEKNEEAENEQVCCVFVMGSGKGFYGSLFGLGPAWTLYMLGFFLPIAWVFGSLFAFSHSKSKKICGALHFITAFIAGILAYLVYIPFSEPTIPQLRIVLPVTSCAIGFAVVAYNGIRWNMKQNAILRARAQRRRSEAKHQKRALLQAKPPGKVVSKTRKKSKKNYVMVPMEDVSVTVRADGTQMTPLEESRAIAASINAKRAVYAETELERNVLLGGGQSNVLAALS